MNLRPVYSFRELPAEAESLAGGKGRVLARLFRRGYPVPDGCIALPGAFEGETLTPAAWEALQGQLKRLRNGKNVRLAVRSSALGEDSAQASFAGEFESVLDVELDAEIREALRVVRASRHGARVAAYSQAQGLRGADQPLAVVIQKMISADYAGVLFTADPLSGSLMKMTGNGVRGLGEKLVSGAANALPFSFDRAENGKYDGPAEFAPFARALYRLAERLDAELDWPQDIEWAVVGGKVFILQARPISTMREFNPLTGELNSSLLGDFLWSNGNAAEIQPEVMTLLTWSVNRLWGDGYDEWWSRYRVVGNIGGRNYFNISTQITPLMKAPGMDLRKALKAVEIWWGRVPEGVTVPLIPISLGTFLFKAAPSAIRAMTRFGSLRKQIPGFVEKAPGWCREMRLTIAQTATRTDLARLWREQIKPFYCFATAMASAANNSLQPQLQADLEKLVGLEDASALLSNLGGDGFLVSLGPVVGLARVARGQLSREAYLEQYGHRGPREFELAQPQPVDNPAWLEEQLSLFAAAPVDVEALLEKQRASRQAAWGRFCQRYPAKAKKMQARIDEVTRLARLREMSRSELTRVMGVIRAFALRAGELTGLGEQVFALTIDELLADLEGDERARSFLPARLETYARYAALPPYPPVISGRFDPFLWAADPQRRADVYDAHAASLPRPASRVVSGFPGSAGVVEGLVRRIEHPEQGGQLQRGEILVTHTTNVGWTPLFPRAAAIVTDVGAPLSHAAIVARELGIPAVVGCNDATMRLQTGDRVRVDGAAGTVEILE